LRKKESTNERGRKYYYYYGTFILGLYNSSTRADHFRVATFCTREKKDFQNISSRLTTNLPLKKQKTTFFLSSATPCGACFHPSQKYARRANASGIRVAVVRVVARCGVEFIYVLAHFFPLGVPLGALPFHFLTIVIAFSLSFGSLSQ